MSNTADDKAGAEKPAFNTDFTEAPGALRQVSPLVRRFLAPNPGPFTFKGTCAYVVGRGQVAVIDPGPDDPAHVAALADALRGETVTHVLVTHTHRDHSPGARLLAAMTGAKIAGCGPHVAARPLAAGETAKLDAANDLDHAPDLPMREGDVLALPGLTLRAVETPGHAMNHLAFAFDEENALFSGDHVMAWSTTIVAPPDGSMAAYMASLEKLRGRSEAVYWPGHGGPVSEPDRFVRALASHRRQRENAVLARLAEGPATIPDIVERSYAGLDPRLKGAAGLSTLAHLEDLAGRGLVRAEDESAGLTTIWRMAQD